MTSYWFALQPYPPMQLLELPGPDFPAIPRWTHHAHVLQGSELANSAGKRRRKETQRREGERGEKEKEMGCEGDRV
jgi:hypothetical protein